MSEKQTPFIDIQQVIASKNATLARVLPNFILNYLKRIIHQNEVNRFIELNGHLKNHDFVNACFQEMGAKVGVKGLENIPASGGCIVAANHPLGGLDGIGLMKVVGVKRTDIRFFVNDILLNLQNFGELFVGVNKHGKNPKENLRLMDEVFASDNCVLFFPAGLVSRRQDEGIKDLEWQKSFIAKAIKYNKPIVPAYIGGENSAFFYNLANIRKKLGVKANIEMLYLADEMYRQKNQTIEFVFGEPVYPAHFTKEKTQVEWAQWLKEHVYNLK
ncbi:MAG: 1-acyl-sn-glycerol-3-phosphate acyltransferase [Saprospiraceae bacterium]|nr:1-acyl-sn-glycerol-3-phosphate acyltransferase [Saprospiraceae bacterium]